MLGHRKLTADDYIAIFRRRRWLILVPLLLFPVITYAVSFLVPAEYLSQSLILVEDKQMPESLVQSIITSSLPQRLASMRETVLSRTRLEPVITKYNLVPNKRLSMEDRAEAVRKNIAIQPIRSEINHGVSLPGFTISYKSDDPKTAQQVCAEVTTLFVNQNLHDREQAATTTTDFLEKQLADAKTALDQQDARVAEFQRAHLGVLSGPPESAGPIAGGMLTSMSTQLETANQALSHAIQQRDIDSSLLAQSIQNAPLVPSATGQPVSTPQFDQQELAALQAKETDLLTTHTENYPDVVQVHRRIMELRKKIASTPVPGTAASPATTQAHIETPEIIQLRAKVRADDNEIHDRKAQQASVQRYMGEYQARIQESPMLAAQYKEISRGYETARQFYDEVLNKIQHSKMARDLERGQEGEQFTVMDGANLPDDPTFPKRGMFALGGAALGLLIGLSLSALLEYRDTVLRSEADVWAFTRLPTLAVIAYSGALVVPHSRPGLLARLRSLTKRDRSNDVDPDTLSKAST